MTFENIIRWLGGVYALLVYAILLYGIWRGTRREAGRKSGYSVPWFRSPWLYVIASVLFLWLAYLGWKPIPLAFSSRLNTVIWVLGALLYFPGLSLVLWGRLTLNENYFVSTAFGAQLFTGHKLVTTGPYALIRHPIYVGVILAAFGSLFLYATWTTIYFACASLLITMRASREEKALAEEFGDQWHEYCKRVPAFIPFRKRN